MNDVDAEVVIAMAACSLNVSNVSKVCHMHRNSVEYRLRRIEHLTGKDPKTFYGITDLLPLAMEELDKSEEIK